MGPLIGLTVLDLTWVLSGPFCSMTLCDLGAEVIKLERPPNGDIARTTSPFVNDESCYFFSVNRGKQSLSLDLKRPEGRELFLRLVDVVDVLIENFTPGTMDRLGVGWEALHARNPRLIYAAVSGFGQTGPDRGKPALDVIVQGMGGVMSITGEPGGRPVRPGTSLGDIAAGLFTAIGILAALHERERSGEGQLVDVAMLDCQLAVLENAYMRYFATGTPPGPLGTRHPSATPFQAFPTSDGYLVIALSWGEENQWQILCSLLGVPELMDDPRFFTSGLRTRHHAELEPLLNAAFQRRTTAEWLADLEPVGIPCGPLNTIPQAAALPQVAARDMLVEVEHPRIGKLPLVNTPVKLSRTPGGIKGPSPSVGQHSADVLTRLLGMEQAEAERLIAEGVVYATDPATAPVIPH
jgi:CoA:oxalate CoA-transferase